MNFGKWSTLTSMPCEILEYLSMMLDYSTNGKVMISMYEYIEKLLSELPSDIDGSAKTLTTTHLFNVNPDAKKLPKATVQLFTI